MVQVFILHGVAFVIGHKIGEVVGDGSPALAHTLSLQTGMQVSLYSLWAWVQKKPVCLAFCLLTQYMLLQSSLLALLLASNFFSDPLICLPCAICDCHDPGKLGALWCSVDVLPALKGLDQPAGWLCSCCPLERQVKYIADKLKTP